MYMSVKKIFDFVVDGMVCNIYYHGKTYRKINITSVSSSKVVEFILDLRQSAIFGFSKKCKQVDTVDQIQSNHSPFPGKIKINDLSYYLKYHFDTITFTIGAKLKGNLITNQKHIKPGRLKLEFLL